LNAWATIIMDPENDSHARVDRNRPRDPRERACQADDRDERAIQHRVAGARSERLPAGMTDVDRGGEGGSEHRRGQAADAVDRQGRPRGVAVSGGLGRLDVLQRAEHVEEAHRDDDREARVPAAE
jgi:hypothetical protein